MFQRRIYFLVPHTELDALRREDTPIQSIRSRALPCASRQALYSDWVAWAKDGAHLRTWIVLGSDLFGSSPECGLS
jgi:hypothetical protein